MTSRSRRWIPVWFLFAGGMINYMDRSAISITAPLFMKDLGLDAARLGIVFSTFFAGYSLFTFIGGYASDVLGPKRVMTLAMTVWSAFCGLTGAAQGFTSLLFTRLFFGCGEGPFGAAANKMIGNWFPPSEIATGIGIANAGTPIGGALAGPLAAWLALRYSWRISFLVLACIGFIWTVFWRLFVTDRPQLAINSVVQPLSSPPLAFYLRQPAVLATGLSFFGYSYILYFFLSWFPSYLTMSRHVNIHDMMVLNAIPWILGTVGLVISGLTCDFLSRILGDVLQARKLVLVISLALAAICVTLAGIAPALAWTVTFMSAAIFFVYMTGTTYWAIVQETVDREHIGAVSGFVHLIANCAGILAPAATGFIVQATGVFTAAFFLASGVGLLGALLVIVFVKRLANLHAVALAQD